MMPDSPAPQNRAGVRIRFFRFSSVAVGSALADWTLFTILVFSGVRPLHAQMAARIVGGVFSFVNNKFWSFEARHLGHVTREGRRFLLLYAISYLLSVGSFHGLTEFVGMSPFVAKLFADGSVFLFNFFVMDLYVFDERRSLRKFLMRLLRGLLDRD